MTSPISSASTVATADLDLATAAPGGASRRMLGHKSFVIAGRILSVIVLMALAAPLIAPYDPYAQELTNRLVPPVFMEGGSWVHPLGTDGLGRDYLSRMMYGARDSLMIGLLTALVSGKIDEELGTTAGYFGCGVDAHIGYVLAARLSMSVVLVVLTVVP